MKLHGMADAFRAQLQTTDMSQLSFEERFAMLVDQQWLWKENRALARRLRLAKLKERGVIEDIDYQLANRILCPSITLICRLAIPVGGFDVIWFFTVKAMMVHVTNF